MAIGSILSAAGGILGGLFGGGGGGDAAYKQAMNYLESIGIPSIEAQQIIVSNPEFLYQFTPEAEQALELGPSRFEEIQTDPRLAEAQMAALTSLQEQGEMPLSAIEKAELGAQRRATAAEEQARQGAILQEMAARGAGGSGVELASRLASSQAAAQRAGEESDRTMAMAQQRALEAIAGAGALGGQIRGQEFGEQARIASAADEIARFNLANQQAVQQRNIAAANQAAQQEALMRQAMEEQRARNLTQQQMYNKQLLQQQYLNQLAKGQAMAGMATKQGQRADQQAAATAQNWANIGSAAGNIAGQFIGSGTQTPQPTVEFGTPEISIMPQTAPKIATAPIKKEEDEYQPFPSPNVGTM